MHRKTGKNTGRMLLLLIFAAAAAVMPGCGSGRNADSAKKSTVGTPAVSAASDTETNMETNPEINAETNAAKNTETNAEVNTNTNAKMNSETSAKTNVKSTEMPDVQSTQAPGTTPGERARQSQAKNADTEIDLSGNQVSTNNTASSVNSGNSTDNSVYSGNSTEDPGNSGNDTDSLHRHIWEPVTENVHHDAVTKSVHHEAVTHVVHHEAVTHEEPSYTTVALVKCQCGAEFSSYSDYVSHSDSAIQNGDYTHGSYSEVREQVVSGTTMVVDREAWDETIVDQEAFDEIVVLEEARDETVTTGYRCSECGAEK